jgi:hypothetical protein
MTVAQLCGHFEQRELAKETVGAVNSPSIQWIIPDWGALWKNLGCLDENEVAQGN